MQLVVLPHRKKINDDNPSKDGVLTFFLRGQTQEDSNNFPEIM